MDNYTSLVKSNQSMKINDLNGWTFGQTLNEAHFLRHMIFTLRAKMDHFQYALFNINWWSKFQFIISFSTVFRIACYCCHICNDVGDDVDHICGRKMSRHFHSDSFNSIFSSLSDVWQTNKSSSHHSISLTIYVVQIMTMQLQWTMGFRDDKDDHDHEHDLWWFIGVARTNCVDLPLNCVRKALESLRLWFKFDMTWHPISQTFVSVTIF